MTTYRALRIFDDRGQARLVDLERPTLDERQVLVDVHYSGVNYKDALAASGRGKILRRFPLTGGIDAAGLVIASKHQKFTPGDSVLVTGSGLGETQDGGYAEVLCLDGNQLIPLPEGLTLRETMLLGTAGFTAALALYRMEQNGQRPDLGPIAVTGASGGVGSIAVQILAQRGYEVWAISGKPEATEILKTFGAARVMSPEQLEFGTRPLENVKIGGAIDNVGGLLLAKLLAHTQLWGNVAAIGLTDRAELETTVMPFILRGVSLLGTSSTNTPMPVRHEIWNQLSKTWKPKYLEQTLAREIGLESLPAAFEDLLNRKVRGRILVDIKER